MNEFLRQVKMSRNISASMKTASVWVQGCIKKKELMEIFLQAGKFKSVPRIKKCDTLFCEILPKVGEKARACYGHDTGDADGKRTHGAFYRSHFHRPRRTHAVGGRTYGKTFAIGLVIRSAFRTYSPAMFPIIPVK